MRARPKIAKTASLNHERHYRRAGCQIIVGLDEAGRGALAGPVAAAAVALPLDRADLRKALRGARDSKEMQPRQRETLSAAIKDVALAWGIGQGSVAEINAQGILKASKLAMLRALEEVLGSGLEPDCLFLDYMLLPERRDLPQVSIVEGDKKSLSIACASIIAKVWRDARMGELGALYPAYGFAQHKGYGTAGHMYALTRHGVCTAHRRSFAPVANLISAQSGAGK